MRCENERGGTGAMTPRPYGLARGEPAAKSKGAVGFERYRHSPIGTAWKIALTRLGLARVPLIVNLLLTYRCNLRCAYCGVWREPPQEMDTATILRLIDEIADAGTERLSLGGGEPMVRRDIGTLIAHAKRRGLTVNLVSNGLHIPRRIHELVGLDFLAVSLDGPEAVHDRARGRGSFPRALDAIRAARAAGIEVWTTTVLSRDNIVLVPDIIALAAEEGVRATFLPVMAEGLEARNAARLAPDAAAFAETMDYLIAERKRPGSPVASSADLFAFYRDHWGRAQAPKAHGAWHGGTLRCHAAQMFCSIAPDGRLYPCNYLQRSVPGWSVTELGFAAALAKLAPPECRGCWCDSFIEANLVFAFRPGAILNVLKVLSGKPDR